MLRPGSTLLVTTDPHTSCDKRSLTGTLNKPELRILLSLLQPHKLLFKEGKYKVLMQEFL